MAKVSIITASYNYENYIKETIESVINQTFSNWEMIIVDDGSKDNSVEVIKEYCQKDERIKLFQHPNGENKGLAETVKLGLSKASADWVAFLESDDTIEPNYLEEKLNISEKYPDVSVIFNDVNMFGEQSAIDEYAEYFIKQKEILSKIQFPSKLLKAFKSTHANLIPTFSCVMARKEVFKNLDFNSPIKSSLDYYLWLQLAKTNIFYYINKKFTNWRMSKNSYINKVNLTQFDNLKFNLKRIYFLYGWDGLGKYILLFINTFIKLFMLKKVEVQKCH